MKPLDSAVALVPVRRVWTCPCANKFVRTQIAASPNARAQRPKPWWNSATSSLHAKSYMLLSFVQSYPFRFTDLNVTFEASLAKKYPDCRLVSVSMGVFKFMSSFLAIARSNRLRSFSTIICKR